MIFNLGSINIDHVYQTSHIVAPGETLGSNSYQRVLGGKGANQSIALARAGVAVNHIGALHANEQEVIEQLQSDGINCQYIQLSSTPSGHAIIQVSSDGENAIVLYPGANHTIDMKTLSAALQKAASDDWLLTQNETNAVPEAMALAKKMGLKVAFNPAPMTDDVRGYNHADIDLLVVNEVEAEQLSGVVDHESIISYFNTDWPDTDVILTQGAQGVTWLSKGQRVFVPSEKVDVVDTTAAGDTFVGYFLSQYSQGIAVETALKISCKAAAITVTKLGASSAIPDIKSVTSDQQLSL